MVDYGVKFEKSQSFKLLGFSDSDWAGSVDDMRSTSGHCFSLGSGIFSWSSKKQEVVAQSTAEAEFIAATTAVNQALWLRKIMCDLHMEQNDGTEILVDNQAAIAISNNPVFHRKTKHFNIKLYFLREVQQKGEVTLINCKSENQLAALFTKPLPVSKFELLRQRIGVDVPVQQSYLWYRSSSNFGQNSGAYIFRPDGSSPVIVARSVPIKVIRGPLVDEIHQQFNSWISQVIRIYKDKEHVELEFTIGSIPIEDSVGKEVITKMTANMATDKVFYTDSNGRDFLKRVRDHRADWDLNVTQPVAGNYYPVTFSTQSFLN
ncbi:Alpha-mannosidase [Capsicum baccatum]|uniref:Alpha-mannosidase n=1 Tax=Capsicum baccatum TaxID=33114 RepID=A0A2G2XG59_CAPBA|nr:Alpha-mannosidase [Capsicum baccatum]